MANTEHHSQDVMLPKVNRIDINFDFRAESGGRDPDRWSPTLQEYHRILWSKPLPNGKLLILNRVDRNRLSHKSELDEFILSSDMAYYGYVRKCHRTEFITSRITETEIREFERCSLNTVGGAMIWPSNRVNGKMTINGARGCNRLIADRLDLTIECIRRFYRNEDSPIYQVLKRYSMFFKLFGDFENYIAYFLLQDYIDVKGRIKFSLPFNGFGGSPMPKTVSEYMRFKAHATELIESRNIRMLEESENTGKPHWVNSEPNASGKF